MSIDPDTKVDAVDTYVGNKIRERRHELNLTQVELAAAIGVQFQQVQKYETGFNRVSASRLAKVAKFLKVPISYFFTLEYRSPSEGEWPTANEEKLLQDWRGLNQKQKAAVLKLIAAM